MTDAGSLVFGDSTPMISAGDLVAGDDSQMIGFSGSMARDLHRNWC